MVYNHLHSVLKHLLMQRHSRYADSVDCSVKKGRTENRYGVKINIGDYGYGC